MRWLALVLVACHSSATTADAPLSLAVGCDDLRQRWRAGILAVDRSCTDPGDCWMAGAPSSSSCVAQPNLAATCAEPVNRAAYAAHPELDALAVEFEHECAPATCAEVGCGAGCGVYAPTCVAGQCGAVYTCVPPPDAPLLVDAFIVDAKPEIRPADARVWDCPDDAPGGCKWCGPYPDAPPTEWFTDHPECIWGDYCFRFPETPDCVRQCSTFGCWYCDVDKGWQLLPEYENDFCVFPRLPDAG
jgi:hypothetical protein